MIVHDDDLLTLPNCKLLELLSLAQVLIPFLASTQC